MTPSRLKANVLSRGFGSKKEDKVACLIINLSLTDINHSVLGVIINFMYIFSKSANKAINISFYR